MKCPLPVAGVPADAPADAGQPLVATWTPMIRRFDDPSLAMTLDRWITVDLAELETRMDRFAKHAVPAGR